MSNLFFKLQKRTFGCGGCESEHDPVHSRNIPALICNSYELMSSVGHVLLSNSSYRMSHYTQGCRMSNRKKMDWVITAFYRLLVLQQITRRRRLLWRSCLNALFSLTTVKVPTSWRRSAANACLLHEEASRDSLHNGQVSEPVPLGLISGS